MGDKTNISTFNPLRTKELTIVESKSHNIPLPEDRHIFINTDPKYDKDYKNDKNSKNAGRRRLSAKKARLSPQASLRQKARNPSLSPPSPSIVIHSLYDKNPYWFVSYYLVTSTTTTVSSCNTPFFTRAAFS